MVEKRNEVDERPDRKWGPKKHITEELVDDMAEIRQEEQ